MDEQWPPAQQELLRCLADGHGGEVAARAAACDADDPLVAELARADAAARVGALGVAELHDLHARVAATAPGRPLLRWWVLAMLGERAFLDTDLGAIPLAAQALHEVPTDPFPARPLLYVRGRLRRIASAVYVVTPSPSGIAEHRRLRDEAVVDFLRCGFTAEVALTRGLSAALHAIATWDDVLEDLEVVRDARALLGDGEGSVWVPLLDYLLGLVAQMAGDLEAFEAAIAGVGRRRGDHPLFAALADLSRALHSVTVTGGSADAVEALERTAGELRRLHPHLLFLTCLYAANLLADTGDVDAARRFAVTGLGWPPTNQAMALVGELLRVRITVLDGETLDHDATLALLDSLEGLGLRRRAGAVALRLSRDLERVAGAEAAHRFRAWGLERMPAPRRRTVWEQQWSGPSGRPASRPERKLEIAVMSPVLEVVHEGQPVRVRTMAAKLLLALLIAHPDPLHVEQAIDVLWPGTATDVGRERLNTVVHRLRANLGAGPDAVRRAGEVLTLNPDGWVVDLFRWRHGIRDDPPVAALAGVTGNLCHVQFPYDDHFIEHRRVIAAEAVRAMEAMARTAGADEAELARLRRLFDA